MSKNAISLSVLLSSLSACAPCDYERLSKLPLESSVPEEYRENVTVIKDVRKFGIEQLGLHHCTQHYTTYSKSDGEARMVYRLFVTKPTVLPNTWEEASHIFENHTVFREDVKAAYFNSFVDTLEDELEYYKKEGYDVYTRNVTSYNHPNSDLGSAITPNFFKDSKAWQAQTITHEICHDSVEEWGLNLPSEWNEPFCGVIGRAGAVEYFKAKKGVDSEDYLLALKNFNSHLDYYKKANSYYAQLQALYRSDKPLPQKLEERQTIFAEIKKALNFDANNAVLWDGHPYAKYYPAMVQLYEEENKDVRRILAKTKEHPKEMLQYLNTLTQIENQKQLK
ncbi:MAG: aminopeptidase [Nanoarchaeota archaeon]